MPEDIRAAILGEEGLWALHVDAEGPARPKAAGVLREFLRLSVADTAAVKARLPCQVATGTSKEMEDLRRRLAEQGLASRVVLAEAGPPRPDEAHGRA